MKRSSGGRVGAQFARDLDGDLRSAQSATTYVCRRRLSSQSRVDLMLERLDDALAKPRPGRDRRACISLWTRETVPDPRRAALLGPSGPRRLSPTKDTLCSSLVWNHFSAPVSVARPAVSLR
jgi:hypothetical protein